MAQHDENERNHPDVVVRIRRYVADRERLLSPWSRDLLVEAADQIEALREEISDAWVWLHDHDHTGGQEPLASTIEVMRSAYDQKVAALTAEVAELRAELAAERGEPDGAVGLHPGWGWSRTFHDWWLISDGVSLGCVGRGRWQIRGEKVAVRGHEPGVRANMRAFEAEARRLGLLVDDNGDEGGA